ncbi:cytochrome P450 86A1 [Colletotrichum lupini]|uniref:Cytochrome P450 86A1 n=1 Tax=Colletotrichum lupini TaxID=145971 RepID=A0A9Q8T6Z7_9PEZI|nr:cytochrome P450 86A1 [Colletotrichum lupini]KAK1703074.1 hypothetical protein BDP67DRAFT_246587 [Colletotrichum lupini]UQC90406.1 cytochrome P450 86A1 [Colletotrichum lupini]
MAAEVLGQQVIIGFVSGSRYECLSKTIARIELNKVIVQVSLARTFFESFLFNLTRASALITNWTWLHQS